MLLENLLKVTVSGLIPLYGQNLFNSKFLKSTVENGVEVITILGEKGIEEISDCKDFTIKDTEECLN